ncbi:MAG: C-type lectin domain-containing protein [Myxococcota bacterium]
MPVSSPTKSLARSLLPLAALVVSTVGCRPTEIHILAAPGTEVVTTGQGVEIIEVDHGFDTSSHGEAPPPAMASGSRNFLCDRNQVLRVDGSAYCASEGSMNWDSARHYCESRGARLAEFDSPQHIEQTTSLLSHGLSIDFVWVDLQLGGRGWEWSRTRTPLGGNNHRWLPGEPNNSGGQEHCGALSTVRGGLNDARCHSEHSVLCEIGPRSRGCSGLTVRTTGGNYCILEQRVTFDDAAAMCHASGHELAGLESGHEFDAVVEHTSSPIRANSVWIGLNDLHQEGNWRWNSGRTSFGWLPNEPNDSHNDEDCAELLVRANGINDSRCHGRKPALCEFRAR